MSHLRCALCNVLAPLVDRLCSRCLDIVEDYLDGQYLDTLPGGGTDYIPESPPSLEDRIPGEADPDDSDVTVDLSQDSVDLSDVEEPLEDYVGPIIDHVPDASAKPLSPK